MIDLMSRSFKSNFRAIWFDFGIVLKGFSSITSVLLKNSMLYRVLNVGQGIVLRNAILEMN